MRILVVSIRLAVVLEDPKCLIILQHLLKSFLLGLKSSLLTELTPVMRLPNFSLYDSLMVMEEVASINRSKTFHLYETNFVDVDQLHQKA